MMKRNDDRDAQYSQYDRMEREWRIRWTVHAVSFCAAVGTAYLLGEFGLDPFEYSVSRSGGIRERSLLPLILMLPAFGLAHGITAAIVRLQNREKKNEKNEN